MTQLQVSPHLALYPPRPQQPQKRLQFSAGAVVLYIKEHFQSTSYGNSWGYIDASVLGAESFVVNAKVGFGSLDTSVREKLEFIETTFNLRVSRAADLLGVTRQALYDWKKGMNISDDNRRKLDGLHRAAQRFNEAGLKPDYATKHRTIGGELEFIQALAGQNPVQAVEKLIVVLERGRKQQEQLEKLLKDRPEPKGSIVDDLPPHYPGE